jgi:phosphomannomutase
MSSGSHLECFKAYDVRGRIPDQLTLLWWSSSAALRATHPAKRVAIGHDIRLTSPELAKSLCRGLTDSGVDVVDIGLAGTEEVYFATFSLQLDGGIMVTASHNPRDYNGNEVHARGSPANQR